MIDCASSPGANFDKPFVRVLVKIVSANELNRAPPKFWPKTMIDVAIAASVLGSAFWTATSG